MEQRLTRWASHLCTCRGNGVTALDDALASIHDDVASGKRGRVQSTNTALLLVNLLPTVDYTRILPGALASYLTNQPRSYEVERVPARNVTKRHWGKKLVAYVAQTLMTPAMEPAQRRDTGCTATLPLS